MKSHFRLTSATLCRWVVLSTGLMAPAWGQAQLYLEVESIPANTPLGDPIYVAGNFNTWNPGNAADALAWDAAAQVYRVGVTSALNPLEFKFTRGSWATVEGNANGQFLPNRVHPNVPGDTLRLSILAWEGSGPQTTASAQVVKIEQFAMPPLSRTRRIWLWLPAQYAQTTDRYPVLYMHDGQNLFDQYTSFAGEWEVDETMDQREALGQSLAIVVGIENGGVYRMSEYAPWAWNYQGTAVAGEGDEYLDFVKDYLKPYIDSNYRTRPEPEYTGMMGSSMGALISSYAGARDGSVYGKIGLFSPAYWLNPSIYNYVQQAGTAAVSQRFYLIAGQSEGQGSVAADVQQMVQSLTGAGHASAQVFSQIHADGQHSEWYWAREFGPAFDWLFGSAMGSPEAPKQQGEVAVFDSVLQGWRVQFSAPITSWVLSDVSGAVRRSSEASERGQPSCWIEASDLPVGVYVLSGTDRTGRRFVMKLIR
ncbi:phosphonate ABC transporter ATP-binding protein [bacterium]|nr:phosphonate ABC transporter ATP-binding protein [bacterium]